MKKHIQLSMLIAASSMVFLMAACKKDNYIVGGSLQDVNKYKNTSTYDFLKTNPLFDTLVQVIDAAGIKDKINSSSNTFFVPTDYAIYSYLSQRTILVQNTINQYGKFGLDSLLYYLQNNIRGTKDSLSMYLVGTPLANETLTAGGALFPTQLAGDTVAVSYEYTTSSTEGYNSAVSSQPQLVYFSQLWKHFALSSTYPIDSIKGQKGVVHTLVQTSNIKTQNGIVHVLSNAHTLFFYGTKP